MNLFDPREPFGDWGGAPPVYVDDVMLRWTRFIRREPPWDAMPRDDVQGMMRPVLVELLNEGRDLDDRARYRRLSTVAREHGVFRAGAGCTEDQLIDEFGLLRPAVEGALRAAGVGAWAAKATLRALDDDFWQAERAALQGWQRSLVFGSDAWVWFAKLIEDLE